MRPAKDQGSVTQRFDRTNYTPNSRETERSPASRTSDTGDEVPVILGRLVLAGVEACSQLHSSSRVLPPAPAATRRSMLTHSGGRVTPSLLRRTESHSLVHPLLLQSSLGAGVHLVTNNVVSW